MPGKALIGEALIGEALTGEAGILKIARRGLKGRQMRSEKTKKRSAARKQRSLCGRSGMELVQVAILVAIAVALGLIFKTQITAFVNSVFGKLLSAGF